MRWPNQGSLVTLQVQAIVDPSDLSINRLNILSRLKARGIGCLAGFCEAVGSAEAAQGWGWSSETTVDQTLIRGLVTAFRVFVSGLSSV
jgi:hypothetical protein